MNNTIKTYGRSLSTPNKSLQMMHIDFNASPIQHITEIIYEITLTIRESRGGYNIYLEPKMYLEVVTENESFSLANLIITNNDGKNIKIDANMTNMNALLNEDVKKITFTSNTKRFNQPKSSSVLTSKTYQNETYFDSANSLINFLTILKNNNTFFGLDYTVVKDQTDNFIDKLKVAKTTLNHKPIEEIFNLSNDFLTDLYYFNNDFEQLISVVNNKI